MRRNALTFIIGGLIVMYLATKGTVYLASHWQVSGVLDVLYLPFAVLWWTALLAILIGVCGLVTEVTGK